ncbi:MAG: hypothetical protein HY598_02940 [Candidatus Omnitrophica bacterium]|nr:hypothetical protein [Candidatus Omnitrophota bacterium]
MNANKVKYFVVGAHAVAFYAEPRFTKDLDVWIPAVLNDPRRVYTALKNFGAPLRGIRPEDFQDPKMILQIGVAPVRIDLLVSLPGVTAQEAWKHRKRSRYGKTSISILGLAQLIMAKRALGRPQDRLDLTRLLARAKRQR